MLRHLVGTLLFGFLLVSLASGQATPGLPQGGNKAKSAQANNKQENLHLTRVQTVTVPSVLISTFVPPFRCDSDGNIYLQNDRLSPAIQKFNSKGEAGALFQPAPNTDKKLDYGGNCAIGPGEDLYELVYPHEMYQYVFAYKSDGTFKSAIKLNLGFRWSAHSLAVFPSGQLLISGFEYDKDPAAATWPFTGIFAADGSLLKEIKLEDDDTLRDMAASGDSRASSPTVPNVNRAVSFSQIGVAADGNAYLMRWTNPAIIYAISPGGEVVRRLKVDPGDASYGPGTMQIFQNRIAVLFIERNTYNKIMKVVDLEDHEIATYDELKASGKVTGGMLTGAFTCYTENPTRFVFLGADDAQKLQFVTTEPR